MLCENENYRHSITSIYEFINSSRCSFRTACLPQILSITMNPALFESPFGPAPSIFEDMTLPKGRNSSAICFAVVIMFRLPICICITKEFEVKNERNVWRDIGKLAIIIHKANGIFGA